MKTKVLILLLLLMSCRLEAQWGWSTVLSTEISQYDWGTFRGVDFISESTGMLCFDRWYSPSGGSKLRINATSDFCQTWNTVFSYTGMGSGMITIKAHINSNTFFNVMSATGTYNIRRSSNIGQTWVSVAQSNILFKDFSIVDTMNLFIISYGNPNYCFLDKYTNGYLHQKVDTFTSFIPSQIYFHDTLTGYISASVNSSSKNHFIYKSVNGGTEWTNVFTDTLMNINNFFFSSSDVGYAVGDSGKVIRTNDAGLSWEYLNSGTTKNMRSVYFINDSIGYAAGDSGLITKTIDYGVNWLEQVATVCTYNKIFFVNDSVGFALSGQTLFKTNQPPLSITGHFKPVSNFSFQIYPNPSKGQFYIDLKQEGILVEIRNILGELIYNRNTTNYSSEVDLRNRPNGIYIVDFIKDSKRISSAKIIIEK